MTGMTKSERDNLAKLARQRARLAKQMVAEREKVLLADIEDQLSAVHQSDAAIWRDITAEAAAAVKVADLAIAEACARAGMAEDLRPRLTLNWYDRGASASAERRGELRRLATARITAAGQSARTTIDTKVLEVETALVRSGLTSDAAVEFLDAMPDAVDLMPRVELAELDGRAERRPWTAPAGLAGSMLTPSGSASRAEHSERVAAALAAAATLRESS